MVTGEMRRVRQAWMTVLARRKEFLDGPIGEGALQFKLMVLDTFCLLYNRSVCEIDFLAFVTLLCAFNCTRGQV